MRLYYLLHYLLRCFIKYIIHFLSILLELLFPQRRELAALLDLHTQHKVPSLPRARYIDQETQAIFNYKNKLVQTMIWELKYRGNLVVAKICGEVIYEFLLNKEKNVEKIILIPIPLSTQRRRERGFNQNELVINAILKLDKESNNNYFECDFISLIKSRHTVPQSKTKSRKERLVNVQNCFEAVDNSKIMGREVILIDDVVTTGTTVKEAMKVLKSAGVKSVKCVALAHG